MSLNIKHSMALLVTGSALCICILLTDTKTFSITAVATSPVPEITTQANEPIVASLPTYAQKYINSKEDMYSLSGIDFGTYTSGNSTLETKTDTQLIDAIYFDKAYLAQYVSTDAKGTINVLCEVTTAGNVYVYDLYSYKGNSEVYEPINDIESDIIDIVKCRYTSQKSIDINNDLIASGYINDCLNGIAQFDKVTVTDIRWGRRTLTDENYNRVMVEFKATRDNLETNNYVVLSLNSEGKIYSLLLL